MTKRHGSAAKFTPQFLPTELRTLVHKATSFLGQSIRAFEGEAFYQKIEGYRRQLKRARRGASHELLKNLLNELENESRRDRLKIAHAFSLQLELTNVCEAAYRTWRQHQKPPVEPTPIKPTLTYVLTAHPTEARARVNVENLNRIARVLLKGLYDGFVIHEAELTSHISTLWQYPLAKLQSPSVLDEAEYIYSLIFAPHVFDFLLADKPNYVLRLRTWVGGDKDGHPGVNAKVMAKCLTASRQHLIDAVHTKLGAVIAELTPLSTIQMEHQKEIRSMLRLQRGLKKLRIVNAGDGRRLQSWIRTYKIALKNGGSLLRSHHQIHLIHRLLDMFPALVLPIEVREDSELIAHALRDRKAIIRQMLTELRRISGPTEITGYARALIISHCEGSDDMAKARRLVKLATGKDRMPIIPLFETREALLASRRILTEWFTKGTSARPARFEVMLGYSDSAKQVGALSSRYLIMQAMETIERTLKSFGIAPVFFHGSGGSVDRGGGSITEQISWWSPSAIQSPKMTIQGEMIQRLFATREILNSQCTHMTDEVLHRKTRAARIPRSPELETFVRKVEHHYTGLVGDQAFLNRLLSSTPYKYLEVLKIGSRPSKRPSDHVSVDSLRAIPWVLCWTQSRILIPTWWGVGSAWHELSSGQKRKLKSLLKKNAFLSSYVKILGFTLAKVELDVWELYLKRRGEDGLIEVFRAEYRKALRFVREMSGEHDLIWYRPWLSESIRMRSPTIHLLNMAQIIAMDQNDEALLRETLVGIASGMLTTG